MMLNPPLTARNGRVLQVIVVCRISTEHQDERSLQDQEALYRKWLAKYWDGEIEVVVLASQGSGESLVRDDYFRLSALVESRKFDLVISEDLGRICRRVHAHIFCETCEDASTRCIALNDHVDTTQNNCRLNSFFAVMGLVEVSGMRLRLGSGSGILQRWDSAAVGLTRGGSARWWEIGTEPGGGVPRAN
ncbi:MAG: hypothetical protein ACI92S_002642 [Planctomycetaceae bacterium]|jgi:hypothetical protein